MDDTNALAISKPSQAIQTTFAPTTFQEAVEFAKFLANSSLVPKDYKGHPDDIFVAMQHGAEIGLQPMQSLSSIAVVNGRASVFGDAALAICKGHRDWEWIKEVYDSAKVKYTCTVKRKGEPEVIQEFSKEDAVTAGLWGKSGPWSNAPRRMLQFRARGFALCDAFPDALKGIITYEEAQDYVTIDSATITPGATETGTEAQPEKVEAVAVISIEKAREFYKVYKESGWTPEEMKAKLKEVAGVEDSRQMPESKAEEMFAWAKTKKQAEAATKA